MTTNRTINCNLNPRHSCNRNPNTSQRKQPTIRPPNCTSLHFTLKPNQETTKHHNTHTCKNHDHENPCNTCCRDARATRGCTGRCSTEVPRRNSSRDAITGLNCRQGFLLVGLLKKTNNKQGYGKVAEVRARGDAESREGGAVRAVLRARSKKEVCYRRAPRSKQHVAMKTKTQRLEV